MTQEETTQEQLVKTLTGCFALAGTRDEFFGLLNLRGVQTYSENNQVEGIVIDGNKASFSSLGFSHEAIQSLDPFTPTAEDLAMIDLYYDQQETEEKHLKASDIVPDFKQWKEELGTERASVQENELKEIRSEWGEEKEIGHELER